MEEIIINVNGTDIKVAKDVAEKAIAAGKLEVKDDNLMLFTKTDYDTRVSNIEKGKYEEGKKTGVELLAKDLKAKYPEIADVEGKDIEKLMATFATKRIEAAKIPESEKIKQYENDLSSLRKNIETLTTEKTTLETSYKQKEQQHLITNHLISIIPKQALTETYTTTDIIALFRANGYDVVNVDGKIVATKNGEVMKHATTLEPMKPIDVMNQFVTEKKLIPTGPGRGGSDETAGTEGTYDGFVKEMNAKGLREGSAKFNYEMQERIKNKTLKV